MLKHNIVKTSWCKLRTRYMHKNASLLEASKTKECAIARIRNIGILAHIDAGKTTTTERMLYYSGLIRNMGEVHHGNTVTDYMEQERQRGITITSAAVTFNWKDYRFNLIDTPGHIDFTMEVEQTLQILDGAIVVLDGSAGVEAQTLTVSRQADRYDIPRIFYVNKMDRADADFDMSLRSIESKLNVETLPVQVPVTKAGVLEGIVDVITMEKLTFDKRHQGMNLTRAKITEGDDGRLWDVASEKRRLLTDKLSGLDDKLADVVIEQESLDDVQPQMLVDSLRRVTVGRKGVPVMLGSSYKNIGVQPLMDSVVLYLPSPDSTDRLNPYRHFGNSMAARVFKIVHDKQKGPITFFRIYSGSMKKSQKLYNVTREQSEQCTRLYVACADDYEEVAEVSHGNIAAVSGLKNTVTGDLVTTSASVADRAKQSMLKDSQSRLDYVDNFFASGVSLLDPVFFCSVEPPSLLAQSALETALQELQREDPSLRVKNDPETEQIVLGGMGELHIDIIKQRIRTEYKIDVDLGPLQIAYRETIQDAVKDTLSVEHRVGQTTHKVTITMSLIPNYEGKTNLLLDKTPENASNIAGIHPRVMSAIKTGVSTALLHGVKLSCPVINVGVKLHWLEVARATSDTIISAATSQCIRKLLQDGNSMLLEPMMQLEIVAPEEYSPSINADLTRRRVTKQEIHMRGNNKVIRTVAPLSELLGYSTTLRIITSGNATFSLEFSHYQVMTPVDEEEAIEKIKGF
ncbi:PREDICTED: ribosome-releasing factor 2, mitochondrial [Vollenhovia emeryi]|uniref:ribosome-releasing factor 2, mitochondrial n=1 Tax=Vollenhovia emeryi TaxID=411798 RepID=UPI0005F578FB|nr:PREDICTED: ribosome-releasing factor 2, mitochondrial [Vollenhovia emeryi]XP_011864003.1 PREDICTED: ribosome-releasing factor 2, mitochondrial [Vollenhovia emeryi]XP_011864004.1 PREDICTED: ribosome-releasing factor 2, mitochondrial [Vollenhovia emeryi]XP_011864005.1 PREDICTED: ribosome-releasing factor 2, mitochondrial [Vollenhovia emeryi]XP_011864007.1 PREDICTED: ribosome-releasing factor 2, mitochondrial [Vollenhovia emeryi]